MTQEDKELLLKDLCARLPYGVIVYDYDKEETREMGLGTFHDIMFNDLECKPYLRPMSSMTEEEKEDFPFPYYFDWIDSNFSLLCSDDEVRASIGFDEMYDTMDWLNANHFDYRNLIEKGLALKASEGMYNL